MKTFISFFLLSCTISHASNTCTIAYFRDNTINPEPNKHLLTTDKKVISHLHEELQRKTSQLKFGFLIEEQPSFKVFITINVSKQKPIPLPFLIKRTNIIIKTSLKEKLHPTGKSPLTTRLFTYWDISEERPKYLRISLEPLKGDIITETNKFKEEHEIKTVIIEI